MAKEVYNISDRMKNSRVLSVYISLYPKTKVRDILVSPSLPHFSTF